MSEDADAPNEPSPRIEGSTKARWLDRARLARLVALAGALAVVLFGRSLILPHIPTDHAVDVELGVPSEVVRLDIRWSSTGSDEDITATSLHFSPGSAPSAVRTNVRLPNGEYDVAITVERASRVDSTRRRITLGDATRVTIPLR